MFACLSAEEQVTASAGLDYFLQARLIDRQDIAVPSFDALHVNIYDDDFNFWAMEGDNGHGRPANVAGSNTSNLHLDSIAAE